jgi:hypothetical protein
VLAKGKVPLRNSEDYQLIDKKMRELDSDRSVLVAFARSNADMHTPYELIRQGKFDESDSILADVIEALEGDHRLLPSFDKVREYLPDTGFFAKNHVNGWTIVAFALDTQQENSKQ